MRVAELFEPKKFRITESAPTDPGPGEVQVRVGSVGICGSDLHYYTDGVLGDVAFKYPVVLGHEPMGRVVKTGSGVTGFQAGDRAFLEPAIYCYHCHYCRSGHHNVCENVAFLSTPPDPGFFREYVNLPAVNLLPVPEGMEDGVATLFEPLAVAMHSLLFAKVQLGETAVVFGAGPIGLLTVAALRASGASRIWCVEPRAERRELARLTGADVVLDPSSVDAARQILQETGKRGVDIAIDCATKEGTIKAAITCVTSTGRVVITGIPSEAESSINLHVLRRKEISVFSVRRSNHETEAAIEMLRAKPALFAPIVTHRRPMEKIENSFHMLETGEDGPAKIVLQF